MTDRDAFGPRYYEQHAEGLGWGPGSAPDAFKLAWLEAEVRGERLLDVACGPAVYAGALARSGRQPVCVDHSRALLASGRSREPALRCACADALRLPFKGRTFDTTMLLSVLEHVDDAALFAEAARVTRGRIIVQVPLGEPAFLAGAGLLFSHWADRSHLRTYTEDSLLALVGGAGWRITTFRPAYPRDMTELYLAALRSSRPVARVVRFLLGRIKRRVVNPPAECFVVAEPR